MDKKVIFSLILATATVFFGCDRSAPQRYFVSSPVGNGSVVEITDYVGSELSIVIPHLIRHLPVIRIADSAFADKHLTNVTIPESVTHIGNWAFSNNDLASINIPSSVLHIGDHAFAGNRLTSVRIPDSVTHIGDRAFSGNVLSSVIIPSNIVHIGKKSFKGNNLRTVTIPNTVSYIGQEAFSFNRLTKISIPSSVTYIGGGAFSYNVNFEAVNFSYDSNLEVIGGRSRDTNGTWVGYGAFEGNTAIASITIPATVTFVGNGAFKGWTALQTIYIPFSTVAQADSVWGEGWRSGSKAMIGTVDVKPASE